MGEVLEGVVTPWSEVIAEIVEGVTLWSEEPVAATLRTFLTFDWSALVFVVAVKTAFIMGEHGRGQVGRGNIIHC